MQLQPAADHSQGPTLVSVLLPVNRDHEYLDEAVRSVLQQSHANLELLLIANGCSDDTWRALQRFRAPRVRLIRTPLRYITFALNLGIHEARGDLIARMDSDDVCDRERLAKQVHRFQLEPALSVLGTRYVLIDARGAALGMGPALPLSDAAIRRRMPYRCALAHPSVMFRRLAIERVGGYMYGSPSEDYDLWLRLARDKTVVFGTLAEPLLRYRVHDMQVTSLGNHWRIFALDFALKVREFLVTGHVSLLLGAVYSIAILLGSPILRCVRSMRRA